MNREDVELLKYMFRKGYTQKQLQIVFKVSKSTVHRMVKEKTWGDVDFKNELSPEENKSHFWKHKHILDRILELREIPGGGKLQVNDLAYINLLKRCHVTYTKVRSIYSDVNIKSLRSAYNYPKHQAEEFDSSLIGIQKSDYLEFLEQ